MHEREAPERTTAVRPVEMIDVRVLSSAWWTMIRQLRCRRGHTVGMSLTNGFIFMLQSTVPSAFDIGRLVGAEVACGIK